jgi:hypothetical protein
MGVISWAEISWTHALGSIPVEEARAKSPLLSEQATLQANSKQASQFPSLESKQINGFLGWDKKEARDGDKVQNSGRHLFLGLCKQRLGTWEGAPP